MHCEEVGPVNKADGFHCTLLLLCALSDAQPEAQSSALADQCPQ